jgi:hypothetical protein
MSLHTFIAETLPNRFAARGAAPASVVLMQKWANKLPASGANAAAAATNDGAPPGVPMH